jgi:hypothetical protein
MKHLADQAPHPGDIRAALQPHARRPRRTALIVGTAVATATAAVAATVVPQIISSDSPAPADHSKLPAPEQRNSAWSQWIKLNLPSHVQVVDEQFAANRQDYQLLEVVQVTWPQSCQLQLHRNGDFDPSTIPAGSPTVSIGAHRARLITSTNAKPFLPASLFGPMDAAVQKTLVWQPVDGIWALLGCESQRKVGTKQEPNLNGPIEADLPMATELARAFAAGTGAVGSPFRLGKIPAGVAPERIHYRPSLKGRPGAVDNGLAFTVTASDGDPATGNQPVPPKPNTPMSDLSDQVRGDDVQISLTNGGLWNSLSRFPHQFTPDATIHGMKAYYFAGAITWTKFPGLVPPTVDKTSPANTLRLEGNGVAIQLTTYAKNPSKDELRGIAESLQLAKSPSNPATWFDAATAVR